MDQTRHIGLVYQQPGEDQYFQIFLNPDGTKADAIWSSTDSRGPEIYTEDEMSAIEQHIKNTFGEFENVFHELVSPDIHVDICVVPMSWFPPTFMWTSALFHPLSRGTTTRW